MSLLRMTEARLPPGFRFYPRDEELVCDYLEKKVTGNGGSGSSSSFGCPEMIDVDLNKCEPWDLPEMACVGGKEWYFFSLRDRKYATGQRTNRATKSGYWKATGKDRRVTRRGLQVGMRKTLVFYRGRAPKGKKTLWVMHEFRMESTLSSPPINFSPNKQDWVLCRVFYKSRGVTSKATMETCHEDTNSPSRMDTFITFDLAAESSLEGHGAAQVPCPLVPPPSLAMSLQVVAAPPGSSLIESDLPDSSYCDDVKDIKFILDHFAKLEGNPTRKVTVNLPQESWGNYFVENDSLSHIWNSF